MKKTLLTSILFLISWSISTAQPIPSDSLYLGQIPPGNIPKIFNLAVDSGYFAAERITFSNDGKNIYYSELKGYYPVTSPRIKYYSFSGGQWNGPSNLFEDFVSPGFSLTSDTMYLEKNDQAYFTIKNGSGWNAPTREFTALNAAHYLQITNSGNYYVSAIPDTGVGGKDWCRIEIKGSDSTSKSLGLPMNTAGANQDFFISRDEAYMILVKSGTLLISYHKNDGNWTNPKNMGPVINWGLGGWGPYVTSDNKYLFYTTGTLPDYSDTDIYWARIDGLVDSLKHTNFLPYLKTPICNQTGYTGRLFNFEIPDTSIVDDDGNNTLTYIAKLLNGSPLPSWLTFDTITGDFSGTPVVEEILNIRVTAIDTKGAKVNTTFKIDVVKPNSIDGRKDHGLRIFPNPSTGILNISVASPASQVNLVEITDVIGKVVAKKSFNNNIRIDLADKPNGIYFVKLLIDDEEITRKVIMQ